ncbi:MAG: hypothetical protein WBO69_19130 [Thermoanaerobaculia bacterium]|jgi:hypothetical protein
MKSRIIAITAVMVLVIAGAGLADTLEVIGAAAMEGSFGLRVNHDNTSTAYVQDNSPNEESIYRYEFLFNPNNISNGITSNWRHTIFWAQSANPRPGNGICPDGVNAKVFATRVFLTLRQGGQTYGVRAVMMGNICGKLGTLNLDIPTNSPSKICGYFEQATTPAGLGEHGLAVVGPTDACPSHGSAAYDTNEIRNAELSVIQVQMGSLAVNTFNRGENGDLDFDQFASFRTLAP